MTSPSSRPISRRTLLRGLGAAGAAGLLAACTRGVNGGAPPITDGATDVRAEVLARLGADVPVDLNLVLPGAEYLTGEDRRLVFGLATDEREFLAGLDVEVAVVRDGDLEIVSGPSPATAYETFGAIGVYGARVTYPEPGIYRVAVIAPDRAAVGAIQPVDPGQSPVPQIDDPFPRFTTPTVDEPGDLERICTRIQDPPCSMHEVSLDDALGQGRPAVLTVSTPAFCAMAICGPVLDVVEQVRFEEDRDDVAWIHLEVFKDAGNTLVDAIVEDLRLQSEPWVFFVDSDGDLADKLEGPTPAPLVREGLATI